MVYVLSGSGTVGAEGVPIEEGQLAVFGPGESITVTADERQETPSGAFETLLLGGQPIREPVVQYGPFVMNTRAEIVEAIEDFNAGRMGTVPAVHLSGKRLGRITSLGGLRLTTGHAIRTVDSAAPARAPWGVPVGPPRQPQQPSRNT